MLRYRADLKWRVLAAAFFFPAAVGMIVALHVHGRDHILTAWLLTLIGPIGWGLAILLAFAVPLAFVGRAIRLSSGTREAAALIPTGLRINTLRHSGLIAWHEIAGTGVIETRVKRQVFCSLQIIMTPAAQRARRLRSARLTIAVAALEEDVSAVRTWLKELDRWRARYASVAKPVIVAQTIAPNRNGAVFGRRRA